jgi:Ca2+-binding RTX toxin-like protein
MMRSVFSRRPARECRPRRNHGVCSRRLEAQVDGLEARNLLTAGSVVQTPFLVTITPASTGPNVAVVSYQQVNGGTMLDVNLNGTNNYFALSPPPFVYYMGGSTSGSQTFENQTSLHSVAWGGSGNNLFEGGSGSDEFFGGTGANTFDAGTGVDLLTGGSGANVFNENATGSGVISEIGGTNTVNVQSGSAANYRIYL